MTNKTHIIDGVTYREVARKAAVGEKIIVKVSDEGGCPAGSILTVIAEDGTLVDTDGYWDDGSTFNIHYDDYRVLEAATQPDIVNKPAHYNAGRFEVIDVIEDAVKGADGFEGACVANILKYTMRYRHKNGLEDVKKAAWYLARLERYLTERDGVK